MLPGKLPGAGSDSATISTGSSVTSPSTMRYDAELVVVRVAGGDQHVVRRRAHVAYSSARAMSVRDG